MSTTPLPGAGGYRVGDAERGRTVDLLKEAHAAGYLSLEEVDERLGAALAARTRGDLDRLVADLPPDWRAAQQPPRPRPARPVPDLAWVVPLVLAVVLLVVLALSRGFFFPWPLLWILFVFGRRRTRWPSSRY
jgi:hypothetical protein